MSSHTIETYLPCAPPDCRNSRRTSQNWMTIQMFTLRLQFNEDILSDYSTSRQVFGCLHLLLNRIHIFQQKPNFNQLMQRISAEHHCTHVERHGFIFFFNSIVFYFFRFFSYFYSRLFLTITLEMDLWKYYIMDFYV